MRKLGLSMLVLAGLVLAGSVCYAAETANPENTIKKENREKMQGDRKSRMEQMKEHRQKMMAELKDIRATAESEGATKTVAKLDAMIKKMEENGQKMKDRAEEMKKNADGKGKGEGKHQRKPIADANN